MTTGPEPVSNPEGLLDRPSFERAAGLYRRELKLHCYRLMGALHEAEDLVQETYLRAWRAREAFEGRSTVRAWLYRIATNACLNALEKRKGARRFLVEPGAPAAAGLPEGAPAEDALWIEPFPDAGIDLAPDAALGPQARIEAQEAVRLAFVAALQILPPRQRAALLLCDVLDWSAAEVAGLLGGSVASVNSALQRARATLAQRPPVAREEPDPGLLARYVQAWEARDLDGFAALLKADATYRMPPWREWYDGRAAVVAFFAAVWPRYGGFRLVETRANGQPAFAVYCRSSDGEGWRPHSLQVLQGDGDGIIGLTAYVETLGRRLVETFRP
jgi:RNA polymerase sigma-70 factor (ECF subfamily)